DGSDAGTHMIANLAEETAGNSAPRELLAAGDRLYFIAEADDGACVWSSDGTSAGTKRVIEKPKADDLPVPLAAVGSVLYLKRKAQLWKSDGAPGNEVLVKDFNQGFNIPRIDQAVV